MFKFITNFLQDILKDAIEFLLDKFLSGLLEKVIDPTSSMQGVDFISIQNYIIIVGISYCTLKFLIKILNTYMLYTDGDSDNPIHILVINYSKSLIFILLFKELYSVFIDIIREIGQNIISAISSTPTDANAIDIISLGFMSIILLIVAIVLYIVLYIKSMVNATLLLILRIAFPLVASGTMDSNGGMLSTYLQKFLQLAFTAIVQIALLKFGLVLILNSQGIWAIIVLSSGAKVSELLKEFMLTSQGGMGGFSSATMTVANLKRLLPTRK